MKILLATFWLFVSLLTLNGLADASQELESESVVTVKPSETAAVNQITVDDVVYVFDAGLVYLRTDQERHVRLKSGQERHVHQSCVVEDYSTFMRSKICTWQKLVKATDTGLVMLPGGTAISEPFFKEEFAFGLFLLILFGYMVVEHYFSIDDNEGVC